MVMEFPWWRHCPGDVQHSAPVTTEIASSLLRVTTTPVAETVGLRDPRCFLRMCKHCTSVGAPPCCSTSSADDLR